MPYTCTSCFEVYERDFLAEVRLKGRSAPRLICPKINCNGAVEYIDELLYSTIKVLNYKKYETTHCCAGHIFTQPCEFYISFKTKYEFPNLPEGCGYEIHEEPPRCIIRKSFWFMGDHSTEELADLIYENSKLVFRWAMGLPICNSN